MEIIQETAPRGRLAHGGTKPLREQPRGPWQVASDTAALSTSMQPLPPQDKLWMDTALCLLLLAHSLSFKWCLRIKG